MADLTRERVDAAYEALMTGERARIAEYWDENLRFEMPGNHQFSGWYVGLDDYLSKMGKLGEAHGGRFSAETRHVLIEEAAGISIDVYKLDGYRPGAEEGTISPYERLQVEGVHMLRWENGRIVEGRSALFGDGVTRGNLWWSPVGTDGERTEL
jgi:hypothetical protein